MKNSDKFKISLVSSILGALIVFVIYDDFEMFKVLFYLFLTVSYVIFNLIVKHEFPEDFYDEDYDYKDVFLESIKSFHWSYKFTITYWWKRFMFYLDYQLKQ